jgi:hypothetical protein
MAHAVSVRSNVEEDGGLVREDLLLNADNGSVHGVVDVGQVCLGGSLSDSAEFVVHGTMAEANPTLVGTEIGNGDATEMGANGGAHEDLGVFGIRKGCH